MPVKIQRISRPARDVRETSKVALASGGRIEPPPPGGDAASPQHVTWDISAGCLRPVYVEQSGFGHFEADRPGVRFDPSDRPDATMTEWALTGAAHRRPEVDPPKRGKRWQPHRVLSQKVPCRRCEVCLKHRATKWGLAAVREWKAAPRTWFGTLTLSAGTRFQLLAQTRKRLEGQGVNFDLLPGVERYRELCRTFGPAPRLYFQALRDGRKKLPPDESGDTRGFDPLVYRYLLTIEPHQDWMPHYHVLIHEVTDLCKVLKRPLKEMWRPHGFSKWKLVEDANQAFYAAKYLGKYSVARVRSSEYYGDVKEPSTISMIGNSVPVPIDPPKARELPLDPLGTPAGDADEQLPWFGD